MQSLSSRCEAVTFTFKIGLPLLIGCGVLLLAQQTPEAADQKSSPPTTKAPGENHAHAQPANQGPIDILTDTRGVDFGPYLKRLLGEIRVHWSRVIPESARAPSMKKGTVLIGFRVMKDGGIDDLHTVTSSGDGVLDRAAQEGVASSAPFQPLPREFPCQYIALQFHFYYNPEKKDLVPARKSSTDRQLLPCITSPNL